jgi:hypothetical protein
VYGHGTFCLVTCRTRMLGAFKWMRNSGNAANRMGLETGKLTGLMTTVLLDSKADDPAWCRECQRQREKLLLTTARKGADRSPARQRRVKVLNQRKTKTFSKQRSSTVEPRQGLLKDSFELERGWLRGNANNRWLFAARGGRSRGINIAPGRRAVRCGPSTRRSSVVKNGQTRGRNVWTHAGWGSAP